MAERASKKRAQRLIVSKSKNPSVPVKAGERLEVIAVRLLDPQLKKASKLGARLCGGTSTCLALVDIDPGEK